MREYYRLVRWVCPYCLGRGEVHVPFTSDAETGRLAALADHLEYSAWCAPMHGTDRLEVVQDSARVPG